MSAQEGRFTDRYQYRIEPVRGEQSSITVGWQLQLRIDGVEVERREFAGGEAGYQDANQAGRAWMAQQGVDSVMQWLMQSTQALQRMTWDEDYRREVGKRIS